MKLLIGIPAFNEEKLIVQVISSLPKKIKDIEKIDVLVLNDGSTDNTLKEAKSTDAMILTHFINRGLGGALKTILAFADDQKYEILVTFDADGQHDPDDIRKLIDPILRGNKDIVIGSRWQFSKSIPIPRWIINKFADLITYLLFNIWTSDSQSGLRALSRKAIQLVNLQSDGMEVSSEFFREIFMNKLRFQEIPVKIRYTEYSKAKGQKLSNAPNVLFHLLMKLIR